MSAVPTSDELPDGLRERNGVIEFVCNRCGQWTEWPAEIADFEPGARENLCGRNQWCIP